MAITNPGGVLTVAGSPIISAGTISLTPAGTSGGVPYFNSATSEASSGALTSNALVLGGGAGAAPKVAAGISSNGTSTVSLGVAGASVGGVVFSNATSGSITLQPVTGALGAVTLSLPAATATLATTANISTALPSATTSQIYVGTGAAGAAGTASLATGLALSGGTLTPNYQAGTLTTIGTNLTLSGGTLSASGGGTPGGSNTQLQYNNAGSFGGSANAVFYATALSQPTAPTMATVGTAGSTTYNYQVNALNALGQSVSSPTGTITTGNASLSGTNYINVTTPSVSTATSCDVWGASASNFSGGFLRFIGNVSCGGVIADQGQYGTTQSSIGAALTDASSGILLAGSLKVPNFLQVGSGAGYLGYNPNATTGQTPLSVQQTVTGAAGAANADPSAFVINQVVNPSAANNVSQSWGEQIKVNVPSTNTFAIPALEGQSINVTDSGSGQLNSADGLLVSTITNASVGNSSGSIRYNPVTGINASTYVYSAIVSPVGVLGTTYAGAASGNAIAQMDTFRASQNSGSNGQTVTQYDAFDVEQLGAGVSGIVNYNGILLNDNHTAGSGSSYAVHTVGSLAKSLFEGPVLFGLAGTNAGSAVFNNANSGSITVTTPTGALGSATLTLPDVTGVLGVLPSATTSQLYGGTGTAGLAGAVSLGSGLSISGGTATTTFPVETAKTSSYQLAAGDMGYTIPFNGSSLTLTIPASGYGTTIFGAGQTACLQNIASTEVSITNSSGGTMYPTFTAIPPGQSLCLQGDGTNIYGLMTVALAPYSKQVTLTDASTITVDGSKSNNFVVTLTASGHTLGNPTNTQVGQWLSFQINQDGTGSRTMSFGANYLNPANSALIVTLNQAANAVTNVSCQVLVAGGNMQCYGPVNSAFTESTPANKTAPANTTTYFMQGLAGTITPQTSGNVKLTICGTVTQTSTTSGDGIIMQVSYGTGGAPANAAALTGTQTGNPVSSKAETTVTAANVARPFCAIGHATMTVGTAYWIDLAAKSLGTVSTTALTSVTVDAEEMR